MGFKDDYLFLKCSDLAVHLIKTSQAAISMGRDLWCHKHRAYETDKQKLEIKDEEKRQANSNVGGGEWER